MEFVPLDLISGQNRHEIVNVRTARDKYSQCSIAIKMNSTAPGWCEHALPLCDIGITSLSKRFFHLSNQHVIDIGHTCRQAQTTVDKCSNVGFWVTGMAVKRRL